MPFPKNFVWGVSAAAYQIEGAAFEDDKGPSVWDIFCKIPGKIWRSQSAETACNHYHRYEEDVGLMKQIGVKAYRLSISWPRVMPQGSGSINEKGLTFYDRLVDKLLEARVQPWCTLFHWDYPQALFDQGGWLNPSSSDWFAEYTTLIVDRLSDRITHWMTLNEPQCFVNFGHYEGLHAPGCMLERSKVLQIAHHVLLAHGKSVQAIRAHAKNQSRIGIAPVGNVFMPQTESEEDIQAARKAMFSITEKDFYNNTNFYNNTWWLDPIFSGHYPDDGLALFGTDMPKFPQTDMNVIKQPLDFFGVNIYNGRIVRTGPGATPELVSLPVGYNRTSQDNWPVIPSSMYWGPKLFYERYKTPIVITENGHQNLDSVCLDGKVHDPQRIDYLHRYLLELERVIADNVDVQGYFLWTLLDNFEWHKGYAVRVGLVHVDFETQKRTPKDSAWWYRKVIRTNGKALHARHVAP